MTPRFFNWRNRKKSGQPIARKPRYLRLGCELLEDRTMLNATLPANIVVGRTLSTYSITGVQNHTLTVTYTVYNEQADSVTGVLLTDALQPGVTVQIASQLPDQNGQNLAWSLGTIQGYDHASITLTVTLPNVIPLQIDSGAHAYGTLNAGSVTNDTPAATLVTRALPAAQLASTPDANTTDPFVQEEAAKLRYDPQTIFNFLNTQIGYESYVGSLRGARGTLWSAAGNSLDEASLGVALFRASGIPAQYAHGTLSDPLSQQLILSMFPASLQTVGDIPPGTAVADPAHDPQLLAETRDHYWLQIDTGSGFQNADTSGLPGAGIGTAFTTATSTFTEVADSLRHKVEVKLDAEIYSQASALFGLGGNGLGTTTVLDKTFNSVDLVGRPLTIGNFVNVSSLGSLAFSSTTTTYTPYILLAGESFNPSSDETLTGTTYQEVQTNFPLGSQILTGLFLNISLTAPGSVPDTYTRTLVDRIGEAARQGNSSSSISINPNDPPLITDVDSWTVNVQSSRISDAFIQGQQAALTDVQQRFADFSTQLAATPPGPAYDALSLQAVPLLRSTLIASARLKLALYSSNSDEVSSSMADTMHVKEYLSRPDINILTYQITTTTSTMTINGSFDLRKSDRRVIVDPGNSLTAGISYILLRSLSDSQLEGDVFANPPANTSALFTSFSASTPVVFDAAQSQGIALTYLTPGNRSALPGLNIPADSKTLISNALDLGMLIIVPKSVVTIGGVSTIAWYEINMATGEATGVGEHGEHQSLVSYVSNELFNKASATNQFAGGVLAGVSANGILNIVLILAKVAANVYLNNQFGKAIDIQAVAALKQFLATLRNAVLIQEKYILEELAYTNPAFYSGLGVGLLAGIFFTFDPSIPAIQLSDTPRLITRDGSSATQSFATAANIPTGTTAGSISTTMTNVQGQMTASWNSNQLNGATILSLHSGSAVVHDSSGNNIGTGSIDLNSSSQVRTSVTGSVGYSLSGTGSLSFYSSAESALGVSADWTNYSATLSGNASITLTTDSLVLNGHALPAGTYTITTSAATFTGSGNTSSPNFAGSASITATNGTVNLGPGSGNLSVGGNTLNPAIGTTLTGYTGTVTVAAGGGGNNPDAVTLNGAAGNVIRVTTNTSSITTDQNTSKTFQINVNTSLADTYNITAQAPPGWTVTINSTGLATFTPAPGLQSGTYPIRIVAQSTTNADLVAQTTFTVTVTPTQPGIAFSVAADSQFTVPFGGAEVPTAFRASIQNLGPTADTYNLTFTNLPAGFALANSGTTVTVPAGQTGILGLYLQPSGTLPAPGTPISFTVTATSASNPAITKTQVVSFTMPEVHAVTFISTPSAVNTTPGAAVSAILSLQDVGNVPESVTLSSTLPTGLLATGLPSSVNLTPGQTKTIPITLTPAASTPLNTTQTATFTETFGPAASSSTQQLTLQLRVVVPGADAIANAAVAANQLGNVNLTNRLNDLATSLTNLVQTPDSAVFTSQSVASLDALIGLLNADPYVNGVTAALTTDRTSLVSAVTAANVQAAVTALGNDLGSLSTALTDEAAHKFTLSLVTNTAVVQPQVPTSFGIVLQNTGSQTTTYDLSVSGLPSGVTATFNHSKITLASGQVTPGSPGVPDLTITLTSTSTAEVAPFTFTIQAVAEGAAEIKRTTTGALTARAQYVQIVSVNTIPTFTDPGGSVDVTARILNSVNKEQVASASFTVTDSSNHVLFTSAKVAVTLHVLTALTTVDLGNLDTTGFATGNDTITVTLTDPSGTPIPGATGTGSLLVGSPVTASLTTTPTTLPAGNGTATTTLQLDSPSAQGAGFSIAGQLNIAGAKGVAVQGTLAYVGTATDIHVVDSSDPTHPVDVASFGAADLAGKAVSDLKINNGNVLVVEAGSFSASSILTFSLANPTAPTLLGQTPLAFQGATYSAEQALFTLSNNHVYTNAFWYRYFLSGGQIFGQFGEVLDVDISNPAAPAVVGVAYNLPADPAHQYPDGNFFPDGSSNVWQTAAVNNNILLAGTTTATQDVYTGVSGIVMAVDVSDPANPVVLKKLTIPGMAVVTGISVQGNQAFIIGSDQYWGGGVVGVTGNVVIGLVDLTNPQDPTLISTQTTSDSATGNLLFRLSPTQVVSAAINIDHTSPGFLIYDTTDPANVFVSHMIAPAALNDIAAVGNKIYTTDGSNLIIYSVSQTGSIPTVATVTVPTDHGVSIVPNSFSIAPTQITVGATSTTLVWDLIFDASHKSQTITWQSSITGLQPGESRAVVLNGTVNFTLASLNNTAVNIDPEVNTNLQTYSSGTLYPAGGTSIEVGGVSFTMADYPGGGTGVLQAGNGTPTTPSSIDIPVSIDNASTVYTLINSGNGEFGYDDGAVEFFGTNGAYAKFDLVQGTNIRDHYNGFFNNVIAPGTPSISFGNGTVRLDMQTFVLPPSFAGATLTDIRLDGYGTGSQGEPFLAGVSVATSSGLPGTTGIVNLPLQSVVGMQIIGLTPPAQTAAPGAVAHFTVNLVNPTASSVTYTLSVQGLPASWIGLAPTVTVAANGTASVPLTLSTDSFAALNDYGFTITATAGGTAGYVQGTLTLAGAPVLPDPDSHGVVLLLTPVSATAGQGTAARYVVQVTNTGSATETFNLAASLPAGVTAAFSQTTVTVPPGVSNFRDVTLTLTPQLGSATGSLPFTVTATSTTTSASGNAKGTLVSVAFGVSVSLDKTTGVPGDTFHATVTNTSSVTDTFVLTVAGPGGLVATLGSTSITLAPGQSQVVPVTTGAVNFAVQGSMNLTVAATSKGNPAVQAAATAGLQIGPTTGLTAAFQRNNQVIPIPGTADFLLLVNNTGNTEDAYTATITSTSGPVSATLTGLDGVGTLVIPTFRLPGLANGAIVVHVTLTSPGQGTVTVQIQSLNNPGLSSTNVATLGVPQPTPILVGGATNGTAVVYSPTDGKFGVGSTLNFFPGYAGEVRTATADVNGDGTPDYIGGTGVGVPAQVAIIDGRTLQVIARFQPFEANYTLGVFVAAADLTGDGHADVVATPDQGGGPIVAVYDGAKLSQGLANNQPFGQPAQLDRFFGIEGDPNFRGGDRPALADMNGDQTPDLIVSAGFLGGPRIALFNGVDLAAGVSSPRHLIPDFFAFEQTLRNGAYVTAGDITGDGKAELAFGGGPSGANRVRVFDVAQLLAAPHFQNLDDAPPTAQLDNFFTGDPSLRGGVRLAIRPIDLSGKAALIAGSGNGEASSILVYTATTLLANPAPTAPDQTIDPFSQTLANGVYVG